MIEKLIKTEKEYFKPMHERTRSATLAKRGTWEKETVAERAERISLETFEMCNGTVKYGPFKGLRLSKNTWWGKGDLGSQCLGLYEKEILNLIVNNSPYDIFVDIGAADGYYGVGVLYAGLAKKAICFEVERKGQFVIKKNWELNKSIGELEVHGEANKHSLKNSLDDKSKKTLILMDIEGFEFSLLQRDLLQQIQNCEVIVEIHNWIDDFEKKYAELLRNLADFFQIKLIQPIDKSTVNIPELRSYTDDNRLLLVSERRPCLMRFLHLIPNP